MKSSSVTYTMAMVIFSTTLGIAQSKPLDIPRSADISISGIYLADPESTARALGTNIPLVEEGDDFPTASYCNQDKTQILTLVFHYGGIRNSFNELRIKKADERVCSSVGYLKGINEFQTGKGIKLGITKNTLIKALGEGITTDEGKGLLTVKYRISGYEHSPFLKYYNMPLYYGEYRFLNGMLIEFSFGFEYP